MSRVVLSTNTVVAVSSPASRLRLGGCVEKYLGCATGIGGGSIVAGAELGDGMVEEEEDDEDDKDKEEVDAM